jgi:hypothetical protein
LATRLQELFFGGSPYDDFPSDGFAADLQGWGSDHPILRQLVERLRPETIIEVGTWKGRSAINMARYAKETGLSTEILCVDTWLGSPETWIDRDDPNFYPSLNIKNGTPLLYYTFLKNVIESGFEDVITPLRVPSETAFYILKNYNITAELIYIDAGHEYLSVRRDIDLYFNLLSQDGVMAGDDYGVWEGVTRAVDEFRKARPELQFVGGAGKFALGRSLPPLGSL